MVRIDRIRNNGRDKMIFWYLNGKPLKNFNINTMIEGKTVILFGADEGRNKPLLEEIGEANITCIFDNDEKKWGLERQGVKIYSPEILRHCIGHVIVTASRYQKEICSQIQHYANPLLSWSVLGEIRKSVIEDCDSLFLK